MSLCIPLHGVHIITLDHLITVYLIISQGPLKRDNVTTVSKSFPQNVCSCFLIFVFMTASIFIAHGFGSKYAGKQVKTGTH